MPNVCVYDYNAWARRCSCSHANRIAILAKRAFQKTLSADIAALEADALLGAHLLKTALAEALARKVLHALL